MPAKKPVSDHDAGQKSLGGVLHTYLKFDPIQFPPPRSEAPDAVGAAFNHMMMYGSMRRFTPEELADAIEIDPASINGLGPSLESLRRMLQERKAKILATYQTARKSWCAMGKGGRKNGWIARARPGHNSMCIFWKPI